MALQVYKRVCFGMVKTNLLETTAHQWGHAAKSVLLRFPKMLLSSNLLAFLLCSFPFCILFS